jgi:hypothetical protein
MSMAVCACVDCRLESKIAEKLAALRQKNENNP